MANLRKKMETKLIRVDEITHELIRLEAIRQSLRPHTAVSMGDVIARLAQGLKKARNNERI